MADYANKAVKEIVVVLAGCIGYADTLKGLEFRNSTKARRSLKAMQNHAEKALEAIMEGLDEDQVQGLIRFANSCNLCFRQVFVCLQSFLVFSNIFFCIIFKIYSNL